MNGEALYNSPVVTAFNCTNSVSPIHDEEMIKPQEGRCSPICRQANGAQRQADDRITGTISNTPKDSKTDFPEMESSRSQRSLCWSDEQPAPPQTCLSPPADLSLPFSIPLHNNNSKNSRALHSRQRRVHFKVKGNKSAKRTAGGNRKVTDYYPIRRSSRKSNTELKCEEKKQIDDLITNGIEEGMERGRHQRDRPHGPVDKPQQERKLPNQTPRHQRRPAPHPRRLPEHRRGRGAAVRLW